MVRKVLMAAVHSCVQLMRFEAMAVQSVVERCDRLRLSRGVGIRCSACWIDGAPGPIRTGNLSLRRGLLYPIEATGAFKHSKQAYFKSRAIPRVIRLIFQ